MPSLSILTTSIYQERSPQMLTWDPQNVFLPEWLGSASWLNGRKKHINISNINFLAPTQNPPFWAPRKKFMCLISWERTQKRDPHKLFRGDFRGGSKRAIVGHEKLSFLFLFCPCGWHSLVFLNSRYWISPESSGIPWRGFWSLRMIRVLGEDEVDMLGSKEKHC